MRDQLGVLSSPEEVVRRISFDPSASITKTSSLLLRVEKKAILELSGDQEGDSSLPGSSVRRR